MADKVRVTYQLPADVAQATGISETTVCSSGCVTYAPGPAYRLPPIARIGRSQNNLLKLHS
jgi:hypothetical protein